MPDRILLHRSSSWLWTTQNLNNTAWSCSWYDTTGWYGPHPAAIYHETTLSSTWPWLTAVSGSKTYVASDAYFFKADVDLSDVAVPASCSFYIQHLSDDTLNVYVNGTSSYAWKIAAHPAYGDFAIGGVAVSDASASAVIQIPSTAFKTGINHIACQVHQNQAGSSDMAFGLVLTASVPEQYLIPPMGEGVNNYLSMAGFFFP